MVRVLFPLLALAAFLTAAPAGAQSGGAQPGGAQPGAAQPADQAGAVIFTYQRIDEDLYPASTLSLEQFAAHIRELREGGYHIAPLAEIVTAFKNKTRLPDRTVAITFDGAYKSALQDAIPLLLEKDIPFAVFFSPGQADAGDPDYMNWDDLRRLARNDHVTLGLHPNDYTRLTDQTPAEIRRQINSAVVRYRARLKREPLYFAYPFGEYSTGYRNAVAGAGFEAAFGQQSGVAWTGADLFALPRFAMTESYADDDRFRMAAGALPLPVTDVAPDNPRINAAALPGFGFSVDDAVTGQLPQLSCYISGQGKPKMQIVGKTRVELRVEKPFEDSRVRLNCTMPGPKPRPGEEQRWRWFGMLFTIGPMVDAQPEN